MTTKEFKIQFLIETLEKTTGKKVVLKEAPHVRRASNKLKNINSLLSSLYEKMSQADKKLKDKIFGAYYRRYNDGDVFRLPYNTLEKLGLSKEGVHNLKEPFSYLPSVKKNYRYWESILNKFYDKGLEEAIDVTMKYLLKKYGKKANRTNLNYEERKEIARDIVNSKYNDAYWIKDYGKSFGISELIQIADQIKGLNKNISMVADKKPTPPELISRIKELIKTDLIKAKNNAGIDDFESMVK